MVIKRDTCLFHYLNRSCDWGQDWHLCDKFWACLRRWNGTYPISCLFMTFFLFILNWVSNYRRHRDQYLKIMTILLNQEPLNQACFMFGWKTEAISSSWSYFWSFFPNVGIHNGRIFSPDVGRPEVDVRGPDRDSQAEQPDGNKGVDTGHLLQERQEVRRSQHDSAQQAVPHHEERHHPLHHEVLIY